ncbi:MAG: RHS repeat-associated core domain-containing protein [Deltaproteobacteria bacterium]|nr:RHS repeat-associated core domain-containing protein [Deltaproteobacteria bacterium]
MSPRATIDTEGGLTRYYYDGSGKLWHVLDAMGNDTRILNDNYGRKVEVVDPDLGLSNFSYNAFGELIATNNTLESVQLTYDELGRLTSRQASYLYSNRVAETSTWVYDNASGAGIGKLHIATAPDGHRSLYEYDNFGRAILAINEVSLAGTITNYDVYTEYDVLGRPLRVTYPTALGESLVVQYQYDAYGPLTAIVPLEGFAGVNINANSGALWQLDAVDARGNNLQETFGDNTSTIRSYYERSGRVNDIITFASDNAILQHQIHTWDSNGNLATRDNALIANSNESFAYDKLNRLTQVQTGAAATTAQSIQYNAMGNILSRSDIGDYAYNATQPHAVTQAGSETYSYNELGQQISRTNKGQTFITSYNAWGKSHEVHVGSASGSLLASYSYTADGERLIKQSTTETTIYIGSLYELHINNAGTNEQFNIIAGDKIVAVARRNNAIQTDIAYLHTNHLGSPELLTGAISGAVYQQFDYWGKQIVKPSLDELKGQGLGYTGHETEDEQGLINMGGRQYDPNCGRFTTADPVTQAVYFSLSLNRYAYAFNNPLSFIDPTGYDNESMTSDPWDMASYDFDDSYAWSEDSSGNWVEVYEYEPTNVSMPSMPNDNAVVTSQDFSHGSNAMGPTAGIDPASTPVLSAYSPGSLVNPYMSYGASAEDLYSARVAGATMGILTVSSFGILGEPSLNDLPLTKEAEQMKTSGECWIHEDA